MEEVPRCFYVGKGKQYRPYESKSNRNHKWKAIVKRLGLRVEVCFGPVTNEEACMWEIVNIELEKTFSTSHSHNDNVDIGCNFTKGGEGSLGRKLLPRQDSDETCERKRQAQLVAQNRPDVKQRRNITTKRTKATQEWYVQHSGANHPNSQPVIQQTFDGTFVARYVSFTEASKQTGISTQKISDCCLMATQQQMPIRLISAGGFLWKYAK